MSAPSHASGPNTTTTTTPQATRSSDNITPAPPAEPLPTPPEKGEAAAASDPPPQYPGAPTDGTTAPAVAADGSVQQPYSSPALVTPSANGGAPAVKEPVMVTALNSLTDQPTYIDCPFCRKRAMTTVSKEGSTAQMLAGAVCCLCTIICTCVPCLCGWFENVNVSCGECRRRVAFIPHDGPVQVMSAAPVGLVQSQYAAPAAPAPAAVKP